MNTTMLSFTMPQALGSHESYVQAVQRFPILSAEQELQLARRFHSHDDLDAVRELIVSHLRVVVSVARGYAGYGLPQADLIQEGNIGLMKAVKRFDPEHGVRLVSFALHWIRAEIQEYVVRNWRMVKIATTKAQRKLFFNLRSLKQGLAPLNPSQVQDIATQLNVTPHDVVEMEARFAGHELALDPTSSEDEDSYAPINYLAANTAQEPAQLLEAKQLEHQQTLGLSCALASLDERSRRIIEARWLNEQPSLTLHDLAAEFKVSAERIRQIEQKALSKMHASLSQ
ncbi:MAG: RNA polymerase sigma factor RpoH [Gallionella sp.]